MKEQHSVLVISFSNISRDPRVIRQVLALEQFCRVSVAAWGVGDSGDVEYYGLPHVHQTFIGRLYSALMLLMRRYLGWYWKRPDVAEARRQLSGKQFDCVLANELDALPLAFEVADGAPVVLDAHEYALLELEGHFLFALLIRPWRRYLLRKYAPGCSGMVTVAQHIAKRYSQDLNRKVKVITNASSYYPLEPRVLSEGDPIRLIHHGGINASRRLDDMIDIIDYLDERFELHLMLLGSERSIAYLKSRAKNTRVYFHEPVSFEEIVPTIAAYDVGFYMLPPTNFNNRYALPNKFFEFVQARLAVAIGPNPEMAALTKQYDLGVVSESFELEALAHKLNALTVKEINRYKKNAHKAAFELNAERNALHWRDITQAQIAARAGAD